MLNWSNNRTACKNTWVTVAYCDFGDFWCDKNITQNSIRIDYSTTAQSGWTASARINTNGLVGTVEHSLGSQKLSSFKIEKTDYSGDQETNDDLEY